MLPRQRPGAWLPRRRPGAGFLGSGLTAAGFPGSLLPGFLGGGLLPGFLGGGLALASSAAAFLASSAAAWRLASSAATFFTSFRSRLTLLIGHRLPLGFQQLLITASRLASAAAWRLTPLGLGRRLPLGFQGCSTFGHTAASAAWLPGLLDVAPLLAVWLPRLLCVSPPPPLRVNCFGLCVWLFFLTPFLSLAFSSSRWRRSSACRRSSRFPRRSRQFGLALGFRARCWRRSSSSLPSLQFFANRDRPPPQPESLPISVCSGCSASVIFRFNNKIGRPKHGRQ